MKSIIVKTDVYFPKREKKSRWSAAGKVAIKWSKEVVCPR